MTQAIAENINSMWAYKRRIFLILVSGIFVLAFMYVNLVHSAIVNVVEREKVLSSIQDKSTEVSKLESKYFSVTEKINMDLARAKGFQDAEVSSFISKKSLATFVSYNE